MSNVNRQPLISSGLAALTIAHTTITSADMNGLYMGLEFVVSIELPATVGNGTLE